MNKIFRVVVKYGSEDFDVNQLLGLNESSKSDEKFYYDSETEAESLADTIEECLKYEHGAESLTIESCSKEDAEWAGKSRLLNDNSRTIVDPKSRLYDLLKNAEILR